MQNIVIDISKRGVIPPIIVTEYDSMSRFFELRLLNNGADYTPPENANYSVWYETNDSKGWYDTITLPDETSRPAVVEDGNVLTVEIAEAATTSCGELAVMVTGDGGYQLTVAGIRLASADVPGYDGAEVEDYYNVYIADMQKNAARAENAAQTAIEYGATIDVDEAEEELIIDHYDDAGEVETWATVSEAWAVGKRNGVDVPSTDETYHNNSKYYAGQAGTAASEAAGNASQAANSAQSANSSAIDADAAKTAAQTAAETAAASASNAANSATAAASSATEAAASATQAASSAASAETAKTAAMDAAQELQSLLIHDTASGAVASFADGSDNLPVDSLVAEITPVQSGSGDPSPTNIRPISGRTGLTVTAKGKNLLDAEQTYSGTVSNYYFCEFVSNIPLGNNKRIGACELTAGTTYTISFDVVSSVQPFNLSVGCGRGTYGTDLVMAYNYKNGRCSITFTPTAEKINTYGGLLAFRIPRYQTAQTANFTISNIQLELGSAPSNYEPYAGQTYPITWETIAGTVYGGTLDVVSGVLTAEYGIITFNGSENWNDYSSFEGYFIRIPYMKNGNKQNGYCNMLKLSTSASSGQTNAFWMGVNTQYFYAIGVYESMGATLADFKAYLAEHNMQVVYPLATPQTYQLTPTEVRTILGGNNIYTDAGEVTVEYVADTKLYIDNKVAELQALILEH